MKLTAIAPSPTADLRRRSPRRAGESGRCRYARRDPRGIATCSSPDLESARRRARAARIGTGPRSPGPPNCRSPRRRSPHCDTASSPYPSRRSRRRHPRTHRAAGHRAGDTRHLSRRGWTCRESSCRDQHVETFGCRIHRGGESSGSPADHDLSRRDHPTHCRPFRSSGRRPRRARYRAISSIQGGLLLTQVRRDAQQLRTALNAARNNLRLAAT